VLGGVGQVGWVLIEAFEVAAGGTGGVGIERPVLVGHSDGASIALIHADAGHPSRGWFSGHPHVFVEDRTIAGIEAAKHAYETGDLRNRLARCHDDPDATFRGWNDVWLSPAFRTWYIGTGCQMSPRRCGASRAPPTSTGRWPSSTSSAPACAGTSSGSR
jgi:hypothetical protein